MESYTQSKGQQPSFSIRYSEKNRNYANSNKQKTIEENQPLQKQRHSTSFKQPNVIVRNEKRNRNSIQFKSIDASLLQNSTKTQNSREKVQTQRYLQRQSTQPNKRQQKSKKVVNTRKHIRNSSLDSKRQLQRVPVQFSDEPPWGGLKGRLVYRGHTPHNSFFMMNNLKQCEQEDPSDLSLSSKYAFDSDLQFNSKFESGNLQGVLRVNKRQYWLFMRQDTNTVGLRQWYFFQVISNRQYTITFRIYRFSKKYLLYRYGMKPYIKEAGQTWMQKGSNVSYCYDDELRCYYLKFNFQFGKARERILVAQMPPYTYSRLTGMLSCYQQFQEVKVRSIGRSLGGVQIPLIQIKQSKGTNSKSDKIQKKAIIILGRTHPAQTCSNFSIQVIIDKLIPSQDLLKQFDFFIVPMINPDGVIVGNHRTGLTGMDLNRKFILDFKYSDKDMFPQVEAVKDLVKAINRSHKIQFLLDLHGHSAKRGVFAYGEQQTLKSERYLKSKILPKLLSQSLYSFRYDYCLFQSYQEKQKTARVYFGKKYNINTLTIQQSYGLMKKNHIGIKDWRAFGEVLVDVFYEYMTRYMGKGEQMMEKMKEEIIEDAKEMGEEQQEDQEGLDQKQEIVENESERQKLQFLKKKQNIMRSTIKRKVSSESQPNDSDLDSAQQQLQNTEQGLQLLRNKMNFKKPEKNHVQQRKSLILADNSIALERYTQPYTAILHDQKVPIISRIMKMREKQKESSNLIQLLTKKEQRTSRKELKQKIKEFQIKFPNLDKFLL